jgi:aconitate hydratase
MRDSLARLGGNASQVNPLVPVELVIDHSVIAERSGDASSYDTNVSIEYERNMERYQLLRWAQGAFDGFRAVPPGMGICHQVNLEYLSRVVFAAPDGRRCDSLVAPIPHHHGQRVGRARLGRRASRADGHAGTAPLHAAPPVVGLRISGAAEGTTDRRRLDRDRAPAQSRGGRRLRRVLRTGVPRCPRDAPPSATFVRIPGRPMFPIDQVTIDYMRFTTRR